MEKRMSIKEKVKRLVFGTKYSSNREKIKFCDNSDDTLLYLRKNPPAFIAMMNL